MGKNAQVRRMRKAAVKVVGVGGMEPTVKNLMRIMRSPRPRAERRVQRSGVRRVV